MRTEDAVTQASGIWVTFGAIVLRSTRCSGAALVITLRAMSRRWRDGRTRTTTCRTGPLRARRPARRGEPR